MNPNEKDGLSRRDFLKLAALGLANLALKDVNPLYSPVSPDVNSAREVTHKFGLELPIVDYPILSRIVDENHPLTPDFVGSYVEPYLVNVKSDGKFHIVPTAPVCSDLLRAHILVLPDLISLVDRCWFTWGNIYIRSGYRNTWMQRYTYEKSCNNHALVSLPDATQHGNGLTFDFTSLEIKKAVDINAGFEKTRVATWLAAESWKYGFVQSYTDGHFHDGKKNEPWHYTYIGIPLSSIYHNLHQKGWEGDVFELQGYYPQII